VVDYSSSFLDPNTGRIWILAISLANPKRLIQKLQERFSEVAVLKETDRFFTAEEYNGYEEGLFGHLCSLRADRRCEFEDVSEGRFLFRNLFICAKGLRR